MLARGLQLAIVRDMKRYEATDDPQRANEFPQPFLRMVGATALEFDIRTTDHGGQPRVQYAEAWKGDNTLQLTDTQMKTLEAQLRANGTGQAEA